MDSGLDTILSNLDQHSCWFPYRDWSLGSLLVGAITPGKALRTSCSSMHCHAGADCGQSLWNRLFLIPLARSYDATTLRSRMVSYLEWFRTPISLGVFCVTSP